MHLKKSVLGGKPVFKRYLVVTFTKFVFFAAAWITEDVLGYIIVLC